MRLIWFLRMAHWAHRPPSAKRVKFVLGIIVVCLALLGIERIFGWPDWLTPNFPSRGWIAR